MYMVIKPLPPVGRTRNIVLLHQIYLQKLVPGLIKSSRLSINTNIRILLYIKLV